MSTCYRTQVISTRFLLQVSQVTLQHHWNLQLQEVTTSTSFL